MDLKFGVIFLFCFITFDFHFINFFWELVKLGPAPIPGYEHRDDDVSASEFSEREGQSCSFLLLLGCISEERV